MSKLNQSNKFMVKDLTQMLKGRKVEEIRWFSNKECLDAGWNHRPVEIILEGGISFVPMADDEGNNGGAISTNIRNFETIYVAEVDNGEEV